MEQTNVKTELPEEQPVTEPTAELHPWVTPAFERVPLNEALAAGMTGKYDYTLYS
jgi:hypothetical protein